MEALALLPLQERTVPGMLRRAAQRFGERPLCTIPGGQWTHAGAMRAVAHRAGALRAAGVRRGDRVAILCSNRVETLETFLACGWIGAVAVPINTASMRPQVAYYVGNSGASLVVHEDVFSERIPQGTKTWNLAGGYPDTGEEIPAEAVEPGETLAILYTSGTTGPAKGVMCPHAQYYWWGANTADILGVREDDVLCTTLPLFHINALNTFAQAALLGCRVAYEARFSASGFWRAMRGHDATVVYLLGAMVPILLAQPEAPEEREHRVRIGLGPGVPPRAMEAFTRRTGVALLEGYGSTETNFVIATRPGDPPRGVMGRARPGIEARVGEDGELQLKTAEPFAFSSGYFGMPDKTAEAWRDGWFHTGDRVEPLPDGTFRFLDRIKDAIRRRGENISSYEVEQALLAFPDVAEAAVYPVRSELAEDEVMAALVPRPGCRIDPAALLRHCEANLPRFAVPGYVEVLDALPRTENGKVQKFRLRERGVTPGAIVLSPRSARKAPS